MGVTQGCTRCDSCVQDRRAVGSKAPAKAPANFMHIQKLVKASAPADSPVPATDVEVEREHTSSTISDRESRPLCFSAQCHQMTHPAKMRAGEHGQVHKDADATMASPMLLAVADGLSQLEAFGIDSTELPNELLKVCEELATDALVPERLQDSQRSVDKGAEWIDNPRSADAKRGWCKPAEYHGPVSLLKEAFETTSSLGSTTVLLGIMDNSTLIHGKLHPMMAVLTIGDSELLLLRRLGGSQNQLQQVFHTEVKRKVGQVETPLELSRVDERVDPEYDEEIAVKVIERGSKVQCVTTYEGDLVVMGSDGVFDNLFLEEIIDICNMFVPPQSGHFVPLEPVILSAIAQQIVQTAHTKTQPTPMGHLPKTPIGPGGKVDDTAVVVAEVVEWTDAHYQIWDRARKQKQCDEITSCFPNGGRQCHRAC